MDRTGSPDFHGKRWRNICFVGVETYTLLTRRAFIVTNPGPQIRLSSMSRTAWSLLIGFGAFVVCFVALMGYAMIRFAYYAGPIPFAPYAIPIPAAIGLFAGLLTWFLKRPN